MGSEVELSVGDEVVVELLVALAEGRGGEAGRVAMVGVVLVVAGIVRVLGRG